MKRARPKAYSYVRWSRPEQGAGDSLRRQTEMARRYAVERGLDLQESTYQDAGISGFKGANREIGALGAFVRAVEDGVIPADSFLLVEALDRLSRETALIAAGKLQEICNVGVTVVTLADRREYTAESLRSDTGAIFAAVIGFVVAHEHSAKLRRRMREVNGAKRDAARKLERVSTVRIPPWLRVVDRSAKPPAAFEVDKARAAVVRRIFARGAKGVSAYKIAAELNAATVPTFEGARAARFNGSPRFWSRPYLAKLLRSETVIGTYTPAVRVEDGSRNRAPDEKGKAVGYYPAIITAELFAKVQEQQASRSPQRGRHAGAPVVNIFGGLCRCGRCGAGVRYTVKTAGKPFLVCDAAKSGAECTYTALPYFNLERLLIAAEPWARAPAGEDMQEQIEQARGNVLGLSGHLDELLEQVPKHSPAVQARLRRKADQVAGALDEAEAELSALVARAGEVQSATVQKRLADLSRVLTARKMDRTAANKLLRQLLVKVVFDFDMGVLRLEWRQGGSSDVFFGI